MLCTPPIFLFVVLNVLQCEGRNQIDCNRTKRHLGDDAIQTIILQNELETRKQNNNGGDAAASKLYESVLKDINDIACLKKDEIDESEIHSTPECYEKNSENDPLMTKFYTFSKMSADEPKPYTWVDLLTGPIIQTLVKSKDADGQRKRPGPAINRKFSLEDLSFNNEQRNTKKIIDDVNFNNIIQLFEALKNQKHTKDNEMNMEVGFSNQALPNNGLEEDKLSPSFLVENKSNYFRTDQGPYNRIILDPSRVEMLGRLNKALSNYSSGNIKMEETNRINLPHFDARTNMDTTNSHSDNLSKALGQHSEQIWPDVRNHRLSIYNFTKISPAMDRANMPSKIDASRKSNNFFDVLGGISLDDPVLNASYASNFTQDNDQSHVLNYSNNYSPLHNDIQYALYNMLNNIENSNSSNIELKSPNPPPVEKFDDQLEKLRLLNKLLSFSKNLNPNNSINNIGYPLISLLPVDPSELESRNIGSKNDLKSLSNYFHNIKTVNALIDKPGNKTEGTNQRLNNGNKTTNEPSNRLSLESIANKTSPAVMSIGEQLPPSIPLDTKPGSQRIILPEYEKMENVYPQSTMYYDQVIHTTDVKFESTSATTPVHVVEHTAESPLAQQTDSYNTLHRNMIPVIDFLGHMWNTTNRKTGLWNNLAEECGGYVIVPLPENGLFQEWGRHEKNAIVGKMTDSRDHSNIVGSPNVSIAQMVTPANRDLLEKFILKKLFDSFRGSLVPKRRNRRSKPKFEDVEDSHMTDYSSTPSNPHNATQLPPTDKWTMNSSARPHDG